MAFFVFPGQGSQTPGMGADFYEQSDAARPIFDAAATIMGSDFLDTLFSGTPDQHKDTRFAQPALVTVETAIARHLESLGHAPDGAAGHSIGEIPALIAAGSLAFDDALVLAQIRAKLMSENVPEGGMAAVMGLSAKAIEAALPPNAEVANFNGPQQTIISGTSAVLQEAETRLKAAGAKRVIRLEVSGPFHSSYMQPAAEAFRETLENINIQTPRIRFISSVTGNKVSDPESIRELLWKQLFSPVRWTDVMACIGPVKAVETGPGRVLQGLAKRMEGAPNIEPAGTIEAVRALEEFL